jgi:hypothetical protein
VNNNGASRRETPVKAVDAARAGVHYARQACLSDRAHRAGIGGRAVSGAPGFVTLALLKSSTALAARAPACVCRSPAEETNVALQSKLFRGDKAFEACLVNDAAHIAPGAKGDHVSKIHTALFAVDHFQVSPRELLAQSYGPSTTAGVLAFKRKRKIINYSYQTQADNIVGKMTIAALDKEVLRKENPPAPFDQERWAWTSLRNKK